MREIVFDTETTGLSPSAGDRIVEIGCIELVNRIETGRTFHAYFNPERAMSAEAQAVHGLSDAFLSAKPLFADEADALLAFFADSPLIAHNAPFDFGFVNSELQRCGRPLLAAERMIDTVQIARARHPGAKHSLDALCTRYGIDRSHRVLHGALLDAQLLAQLYVELHGGRQIGLELAAVQPEPIVMAASLADRTVRPPRTFVPSAAEVARHQEFLAQLNDPLWRYAASVG